MLSDSNLTNKIQEKFARARELQSQGNVAEAIAEYRAIVEMDKDNLVALHQIGQLWEGQGDFGVAVEFYRRAIEIDPNPPFWIYRHLGFALTQQEKLPEAVEAYQNSIALHPEDVATYGLLGQVFGKLGDIEASISSYQKQIELSSDLPVWVYLNLGSALSQIDRLEEAIEAYEKALELEPENTEIRQLLAAVTARKEAGAIDPVAVAKRLQGEGKLEEALAEYRSVLEKDGSNLAALHQVAQICEGLGRWDEAVEGYRRAVEVDAESPFWVYRHLGFGLSQLGDLEGAIGAYEKAVELNPEDAATQSLLGQVKRQQGDIEGAIFSCQKAIELDAESPAWVYSSLDELLREKKRKDAAIAIESTAIGLQSNELTVETKSLVWQQLQSQVTAVLEDYCQTLDKLTETSTDRIETLENEATNVLRAICLAMGNTLIQSGHLAEATQFHQRVASISIKPTQISSRSNLIDSETNLKLPFSQTPKVSVIIPVYNKIDYTFRCLKSIAKNLSPDLAVEVLVVNDCSTDDTQSILEQVEGLKLVNNQKNSGFIHSCNSGAAASIGKYLYFLNNDTEILPGCIEELVEVLEQDATVGAVGSKLVYPDGSLQEAGGIIWSDATGWNYGRNQNPHDPQYNYLRPVDYCSGASLLVPRQVFEKLNGFERDFAPAYYEDTDLCFAIRNTLHMKVMCQPKSVLIHYEGVSSGTSTSSGVKRYQVVNAAKFKEKWKDALATHLNGSAEIVPKAARRFLGERTILIINPYPPCYDKESGARRLFELIKLFKQLNYHVIFAPDNGYKEEPYVSQLENMQVEVLYTQDGYGVSVPDQIQERLPFVDFAWIGFPDLMNRYLPLIRQQPHIKIIYDTIDLHYVRMKRGWEMLPSPRDLLQAKAWIEMQVLELEMAQQADLTITVTPIEQQILQEQEICNVAVVPNIHFPYTGKRPGFADRNGLLFIGGYNHPPNVDAVVWLCEEILPIIWEQMPEVRVTLLGSNPPETVQKLAEDERVRVTGYVEDVTPDFLSHRVFVAPLRYGAGMKGKVGQSLEYGLPLVSTQIGVEGMGLVAEEQVLVADTTEEFAQQILRLYRDEGLWNNLALKAEQAIAPYTPEQVKPQLADLMNQLIDP